MSCHREFNIVIFTVGHPELHSNLLGPHFYKEMYVPLKIYNLLYVGHRFYPEAPTMPEAKHYILPPTLSLCFINKLNCS